MLGKKLRPITPRKNRYLDKTRVITVIPIRNKAVLFDNAAGNTPAGVTGRIGHEIVFL